ncbi:MAG: hypothetical protein JSV79_08745 [Armatimonadota bacterium]|nr:MAG: hypothetical protein JSV79_08745 [Armatimonadota bacterium]
MKTRRQGIAIVLMVGLLSLGLAITAAQAIDLGSILKVGGVVWLVSQYGDQIDSFLTSALDERDAAARGATKVVPILSLGRGGYVGAAQVVGNPENVKSVKAVVQVEGKFGSARAQLLLPTTTDKVSGSPDRAKGVGVSAVIEFRI